MPYIRASAQGVYNLIESFFRPERGIPCAATARGAGYLASFFSAAGLSVDFLSPPVSGFFLPASLSFFASFL